jgi:hypothetical protein
VQPTRADTAEAQLPRLRALDVGDRFVLDWILSLGTVAPQITTLHWLRSLADGGFLEDDDDELPEINRYLKNSAADSLRSLVFDHSLQGIPGLSPPDLTLCKPDIQQNLVLVDPVPKTVAIYNTSRSTSTGLTFPVISSLC